MVMDKNGRLHEPQGIPTGGQYASGGSGHGITSDLPAPPTADDVRRDLVDMLDVLDGTTEPSDETAARLASRLAEGNGMRDALLLSACAPYADRGMLERIAQGEPTDDDKYEQHESIMSAHEHGVSGGRPRRMLALLDKVNDMEGGSANGEAAAAWLHWMRRDKEDAKRHAERALRLDPHNSLAGIALRGSNLLK